MTVPVRGFLGRAAAAGLLAVVRGYRLFLRAHLGNRCRFEPTCSVYAIEAIEQHGAAVGSLLSAKRLMRCHPWCDAGYDPVPARRLSFLGTVIGEARRPAPTSPPRITP